MRVRTKMLAGMLALGVLWFSCGCSGTRTSNVVSSDETSVADSGTEPASTTVISIPDSVTDRKPPLTDTEEGEPVSPVISYLASARLYSFQKDNDVTYSVFWSYTLDDINYLFGESWDLTPETGAVDLSYVWVSKFDNSTINKAELTYLLEKSDLKYPLTGGTLDVSNFSLRNSGTVYVADVKVSRLDALSYATYDEFKATVDSYVTPYTFMFGTPGYAAPADELKSAAPFAVNVNSYVINAGTYTLDTGETIPVTMLKAYFWYPRFMVQETWYINIDRGLVTASDALLALDDYEISGIDEATEGRLKSADWVYNSDGGYYEPVAGQGTPIMEPDLLGASLDECISTLCNKYAISYTASCEGFSKIVVEDDSLTGPSSTDIYIRYTYAGD